MSAGIPRRYTTLAGPLIAVVTLLGCGPEPEERIAGRWTVDSARWLADESLAELPEATRASLEPLATGLVADTRFVFEEGRCQQTVAGRTTSLACRVHSAERGTVVLRATTADGAVEWLRITPDGSDPRIEWGGRTLPVRRAPPPQGPESPEK